MEKKNKIPIVLLWAGAMILVIIISLCVSNIRLQEKEDNIIIYDGSENNPYIKGVQ